MSHEEIELTPSEMDHANQLGIDVFEAARRKRDGTLWDSKVDSVIDWINTAELKKWAWEQFAGWGTFIDKDAPTITQKLGSWRGLDMQRRMEMADELVDWLQRPPKKQSGVNYADTVPGSRNDGRGT
jgi:hypothetical protein